MSQERLWTIPDVAAFLRVTNRTVYRLAQGGSIPAFKVGWMWRFRETEVRRWLEQLRNEKSRGPGHGRSKEREQP